MTSAPNGAAVSGSHEVFSRKDVVFIFPKEKGKEPCLWAEIASLKKVSKYWEQLFNSGYNESVNQLDKLSRWKKDFVADIANILTEHRLLDDRPLTLVEDSDDESAEGAKEMKIDNPEKDDSVVRFIIVTDASMKSYRALFKWIDTRQISFSGLKSLGSVRDPHLSSPKSIYALAHKLGIQGLQNVALANFSTQLTAKNALQELFSGHASIYPEISSAAMKAVIANAKTIKAAGGPEYLTEVLRSGQCDMEYASAMAGELFKKL